MEQMINAQPSGYFWNKVKKQFKLIGYGLQEERNIHSHVGSGPITVEQLANRCTDLGCRGFDTNGNFYSRLDTSFVTPLPQNEQDPALYEVQCQPPWHLVDVVYRNVPKCIFESLEIDVEFENDVPSDVNFYFCFFGGHSSHGGFYGGLQTAVGCPEAFLQTEHEQTAVQPDYGCIFSRWGPASPDDVSIDPGSFYEAGGYEGDFVSVRKHIKWKKGTYTLKLIKEGTDSGVWIRFQVRCLETQQLFNVGKLRFRGDSNFSLGSHVYNFVEIYGPVYKYVQEIPEISCIISKMKINGKPWEPTAEIEYFKQCPRYVDVSVIPERNDWHLKYKVSGKSEGLEYIVQKLW